MDIVKRLLSRIQDGHWWVMEGGFTKSASRRKGADVRNSRKLTVYSTGDHLMYMADTYAQIQAHDCNFTPYDTAFYIAFADPTLVGSLVEFFELFRQHGGYASPEPWPQELIDCYNLTAIHLRHRVEMLERDYVEPQEVDVP